MNNINIPSAVKFSALGVALVLAGVGIGTNFDNAALNTSSSTVQVDSTQITDSTDKFKYLASGTPLTEDAQQAFDSLERKLADRFGRSVFLKNMKDTGLYLAVVDDKILFVEETGRFIMKGEVLDLNSDVIVSSIIRSELDTIQSMSRALHQSKVAAASEFLLHEAGSSPSKLKRELVSTQTNTNVVTNSAKKPTILHKETQSGQMKASEVAQTKQVKPRESSNTHNAMQSAQPTTSNTHSAMHTAQPTTSNAHSAMQSAQPIASNTHNAMHTAKAKPTAPTAEETMSSTVDATSAEFYNISELPVGFGSDTPVAPHILAAARELRPSMPTFADQCLSLGLEANSFVELYSIFNAMNGNDTAKQCGGVLAGKYMPILKDENLVVYKADNEVGSMTVISDFTCPYCKRVHDEIPRYLEQGITVKVFPYGRQSYVSKDGSPTTISNNMDILMCEKSNDRKMELMDELMGNPRRFNQTEIVNSTPVTQQCRQQNYIYKVMGNVLTRGSTPMLVASTGVVGHGYIPYGSFISQSNLK